MKGFGDGAFLTLFDQAIVDADLASLSPLDSSQSVEAAVKEIYQSLISVANVPITN